MGKQILILGCGWVGEELALTLLRVGYQVYCTVTSAEKCARLREMGIQAIVVDFDNTAVGAALPAAVDYMVTSVPASSKSSVPAIAERFAHVSATLRGINYKRHIFLSSIGIYPDADLVFDETHTEGLNLRLKTAEDSMLALPNTLVYRLAGLFGKNRIFAKYFEDKVCTTGEQPANFVHLDDVVALLILGLTEELSSKEIFNIVAPEHPSKAAVIQASAQRYGYRLPESFKPVYTTQKIVRSDKIRERLNYTFRYPSPLNF
ncbi:GDP-L-fucose synthase [Sphingobacterium sp. Mn56C]|uniref:GDP-L-fucose synthase n=1 Tax=Sphingobacterium sp. Mn56C TaxID=3395261 RepID=UPI003BE167BE